MNRFRRLRRFLRIARYAVLALVGIITILLLYAYVSLPKTGNLNRPLYPFSLTIADGNERTLGFLASDGSSRSWLPVSRIPVQFLRLVVFLEDAGFWYHRGIDLRQIYHALLENIAFGEMKYGASTITQQLAKNVFLSRQKTILRKIKEMMLAVILESRLSKQSIMEWYLNIVEMAPGVYGLRAGSLYHFGKEPRELSFPELLSLACLLPAPAKYTIHPELLRKKIQSVARKLRGFGRINLSQLQAVDRFAPKPKGISLARQYPGLARLCRRVLFGTRKGPDAQSITLTVQEPDQLALEKALSRLPAGKDPATAVVVLGFGTIRAAALLPAGRDLSGLRLPPPLAGYTLERIPPDRFPVSGMVVARKGRAVVFTPPLRALASLKGHARFFPHASVK